ncbi:hypothetical protein ACS8E2_05500 [Psychrobacter glaciei]|uniref:hypothetical protein n=1 Tax=Psychrobacter glaciei TaxID=619771 RepID=UPI003F48D619
MKAIILNDAEKIGVITGRITQARMPIPPDKHPSSGFYHPSLKLDSRVGIGTGLNVKVTGLRVERIQSISEHDARACGYPKRKGSSSNQSQLSLVDDVRYFDDVWDEKYGLGAYKNNDWVWVIDFKKWG